MIYKIDNPARYARYYPQFVDYFEDNLIIGMCGRSFRLPAVLYDQLEVFNNEKYVFIPGKSGEKSN